MCLRCFVFFALCKSSKVPRFWGFLSGYVPSVEKIIQSSVTMLHDAMNAVVKQILETTPPCANTEVYFGPEGTHSMISMIIDKHIGW